MVTLHYIRCAIDSNHNAQPLLPGTLIHNKKLKKEREAMHQKKLAMAESPLQSKFDPLYPPVRRRTKFQLLCCRMTGEFLQHFCL